MNNWQHKVSILRLNFSIWRKRRRGNRYLKTLPEDERRQFLDGTHPSLSHDNAKQAQPHATELQDLFTAQGHRAKVEIGFYHLDRLILYAEFSSPLPRKRDRPEWFHGYEVLYHKPEPH